MQVEYNGVILDGALTESWDEQVAYDSSGVNMTGNKITMTFQGSVYKNDSDRYAPRVTPPISTMSFDEALNVILRRLSIPRGTLLVYSNAYPGSDAKTQLFVAYPQGSGYVEDVRNVDVNNGPKPISVRVVQKTDIFAVISFTIEVNKIRCLGGETPNDPNAGLIDPTDDFVVSHRTWTEESIDSQFYTTRTTYGRIKITNATTSAHWYREAWRAPLEDGFKRESVRFSESEDGLTLSYVVTDRQVQNAAPFPATSFNGNVSYSVVNNAEMNLQMTITMIGRVDSPRQELMTRALQAVTAKLRSYALVANGVINRLTFSENLEDPPSVTASMNAILYVKTKETKTTPTDLEMAKAYFPLIDKIGQGVEFYKDFYYDRGTKLVEYDRRISPSPSPYGYNTYVVTGIERDQDGTERITWDVSKRNDTARFIRSLATVPCVLLTPAQSQTGGTDYGTEDNRLSTSVYDDNSVRNIQVDKANTGITAQALAYPYTVYKSDITYDTSFNRVVLPQQSPEKYPAEIRAKIQALEGGASPIVGTTLPGSSTLVVQNQISALYRQLNNARVVELSRAVPRARVIIEAERIGRMPDMPSPNEVVTTSEANEDDKITFIPIASKITHCEPIPAPMDDRLVYKVIGVYDYAMSRHIRKGDKIWLLSNPIYEGNYYPETNDTGELPSWVLDQMSIGNEAFNEKIIEAYSDGSLRSAYVGGQLNHNFTRLDVNADADEMVGWNAIKRSSN